MSEIDDGKVERVAKAIALARGHASANAMVTRELAWTCDGLTYPVQKTAPVWTFYIETALEAIKAVEAVDG